MASNIKWFKRAYRALNAGENQIWEVLKVKLSPDRIKYLENVFMEMPSNATPIEEPVKAEENIVTEKVAVIEAQEITPPVATETKTTRTRKKVSKTTNKTKTKPKTTKSTPRVRKNERTSEQNK